MIQGNHMVTQEHVPPAGKPGECFWCQSKVGTAHTAKCVVRTRSVIVRLVIEYPIEVPESWTPENIEFQRNESGWCAGNLVQELEALNDQQCLCPLTEYTYIREATSEDHERTGFQFRGR